MEEKIRSDYFQTGKWQKKITKVFSEKKLVRVKRPAREHTTYATEGHKI